MTTLDADVQAATTVINDLVSKVASLEAELAAAGSGVSQADQTALESAITAGQAAVAPPAAALSFAVAGAVSTPVGQAASFSVGTASGGTEPYTYAITGLPDGLTAAENTVTGTPGAAGTFTLDVTVTDAAGATATGSLVLTVQ